VGLAIVGAGLASTEAAGGPEAFQVPPFHVGDRVEYNGSFDYSVLIQGNVAMRLMDGTVATLPADAATSRFFGLHDMLEAWDPATGAILAERFSCPARHVSASGASECLPYVRWDWNQAGFPAMLGIAALQGVDVSVGQTWTTPRACDSCAPPTRFSVESPSPESPPGTAFSVRVEPAEGGFPWERWRLDMPSGSPYPLRLTVGPVQADLVHLERGDAPAGISSATRATTFASRPGAQPYADGIPVEGTPSPGWHAWSDARNATRSTALPTDSSILTSVGVSRLDRTLWVGDIRLTQSREARIVVDSASPGEPLNTEVAYSQTQPFPDIVGRAGLMPRWEQTESRVPGPAPEACAHRSIPLWDLVRIAEAYAGSADISGWHYNSYACGAERLTVSMPSPGPFEDKTTVAAQTGLLREQFVWVG
jgi:hypothetical protein